MHKQAQMTKVWSEQFHVDGICGTLIVNPSGSSRLNEARSKIDPLREKKKKEA